MRGAIAAFDFEYFARLYDLGPETRYRTFQGRKILVANDVHSWS